MSWLDDYHASLHGRLMDRLSDEELERRWAIARGRNSNAMWAQERIDIAIRRGEQAAAAIKWE